MNTPRTNPYETQDRFIGIAVWSLAIFLFVIVLNSCAAIRKQAWTGAGAAGGAALGAAVGGPIGAAVGGAAGAITVGATAEAQEYRDGDVVGEEALKREMDRWRGTALASQAKAVTLETWMKWGALIAGIYFAWRNREHLMAFGPGYMNRLGHAMFGVKLKRRGAE